MGRSGQRRPLGRLLESSRYKTTRARTRMQTAEVQRTEWIQLTGRIRERKKLRMMPRFLPWATGLSHFFELYHFLS